MLEGRAGQFTAEVAAAEDIGQPEARGEVEAAIDRWVWYAGWPDKIAQVPGAANPVARPYFNFSVPEPTGVVSLIVAAVLVLLRLVWVLVPGCVTGNTAWVGCSVFASLPAVSLA